MPSPGLYSLSIPHPSNRNVNEKQRAASPHHLHYLQAPKETPHAEVDIDMISGRKIINTYEIKKEIGRGEHGKVKLGRDIEQDLLVAIKIVPRYSKQRRLGRLGAPQDQTKREVAILKKARHQNVVSLLEVIDDPSKNKVYLVLEYVEGGEIKWRKRGVPIVCRINNARYESERRGVSLTLEPSEHDAWLVNTAALKHSAIAKARLYQPNTSSTAHFAWEHDIEAEGDGLERTPSQAHSIAQPVSHSEFGPSTRTNSHDEFSPNMQYSLAGSMYGPYVDDTAYRPERKFSVATALSHMSSEVEFDLEDEEIAYVPALTQEQAKRAFRDTLRGLEFLHAIGIIHRDIKPSNLLWGKDEMVKISDFGVSYLGQPMTDEEAETNNKVQEKDAKPLDDDRELARSVGTPGFWAPELCYEDPDIFADGKTPKITGAIDLWSLGITLYAMVYARLPFYASETLGLNAAICTAAPILPRTRLVPVEFLSDPNDDPNHDFVVSTTEPINSNKRLDFELKFEIVPDNLRDLISRLLIKDPVYRITIADAKQHPWVLENLVDSEEFLRPPEVLEKGKKRITEPNEKEISAAIKQSFLGKITQAIKGSVSKAFGGTTGRRRAESTSTNTAASTSSESVISPSGSVSSTRTERGREARRTSLPPDEIAYLLQRSRDNSGHPLAQSQTASPDNQELPAYFPEPPRSLPSVHSSPRVHPVAEPRPKLPDRAISGLSTADSVRTVRASQVNPPMSLETPLEHDGIPSFDATLRAKMENLWEGTTRTLTRLASRDRRNPRGSRSPSTTRQSSESDSRAAAPSLAISNTQASGTVETPEALRSPHQQFEQPFRSAAATQALHAPDDQYRQPLTSSPAAFSQAQEINHRRHILEAQREIEEQAGVNGAGEEIVTMLDCPPSPDDLAFKPLRPELLQEFPLDSPLDAAAPHGELPISTAASSVEDFTNSSVTQSISNPSFIATSGASSPPEESFLSAEYREHYTKDPYSMETEPDFMRTADTVTDHGRSKPQAAIGKSIEQQSDVYDDDGDDEESSDEDDIVMMGGPKKTAT